MGEAGGLSGASRTSSVGDCIGFCFKFFGGVSRRNYPSHSLVPSHGGVGVGGGAV